MRMYNIEGSKKYAGHDYTLLELSRIAVKEGLVDGEFEALADLTPGQFIPIADLSYYRVK